MTALRNDSINKIDGIKAVKHPVYLEPQLLSASLNILTSADITAI